MFEQWPVWAAFAALFGIALLRGGAIYGIGRGLRAADARRSRRGLLSGPAVGRAENLVRRYGAPVVALSFLTVGVQSAINAAAGMLRMPLSRYLPALAVGAVLWSAIYTTIGMAVVYAVVGSAPVGWTALAVAGVLLVATATRYARRRTVEGEDGRTPQADPDAKRPR